MKALAALDFGMRAPIKEAPARRIAGATVQIAELEALRHDADLFAPEAAGLAEPLVNDYRAVPSSGDHLRLPPCSNKTAAQIARSLDRFLSSEAQPGKEERLH